MLNLAPPLPSPLPSSPVLSSPLTSSQAPVGFPYDPRKNDILMDLSERKNNDLDWKLKRLEQ
eukprot:500613-Hanusia_phi.AAC.1